MFLQLSPIHHLWSFTTWFIYPPRLHIHITSRERLTLSGSVLLLILMDSEPCSSTCSPPTNMWWWSSILLWQQILHSTDPLPLPPVCLCSTCEHLAQKKKKKKYYKYIKCFMYAFQLCSKLGIILLCCCFLFTESNNHWNLRSFINCSLTGAANIYI